MRQKRIRSSETAGIVPLPGSAKPSASQICYVDLSEPDNVVIYEQAKANVLSRVATAVGHDVVSIVEYFK